MQWAPKDASLLQQSAWRKRILAKIAAQGYSRSFILQSITGRQGLAYRYIIRSRYSNDQKLPSLSTHSHLTPPPRGTPAKIPINLIFPETRIIGLHFCRRLYRSIFIQICAVGSKRRIFYVKKCIFAVQGHSGLFKVDDFGTNRKRTYDFLLVINSNYGPILHRFRDTAIYWLKIAYFSYPPLIRRHRSLGFPWSFLLKFTMRKLD